MLKILTVGGATQDIYIQYECEVIEIPEKDSESFMLLRCGEKIEIDEIVSTAGGGAINSATSFKKLGHNVSICCKIGDDEAGRLAINELKTAGVDLQNVVSQSKHPTAKSFIISSVTGDRSIFVYRGANRFLSINDIPMQKIGDIDLLYITSLSKDAAKLLPDLTKQAKENGVRVASNPGSSQLTHDIFTLVDSLGSIDLLIINKFEAELLAVSLIKSGSFHAKEKQQQEKELPFLYPDGETVPLKSFLRNMLRLGPEVVVVTDGKSGVYCATQKTMYWCPALEAKVVDTVGAGDAFGSCFSATLLKSDDIELALRAGNINSAAVIGEVGAKTGQLSWSQIEKRLKKEPSKIKKFPM